VLLAMGILSNLMGIPAYVMMLYNEIWKAYQQIMHIAVPMVIAGCIIQSGMCMLILRQILEEGGVDESSLMRDEKSQNISNEAVDSHDKSNIADAIIESGNSIEMVDLKVPGE